MTWHRRKFSVVGQLGYIERACPRSSNPIHWDWNVVTFELRTRGDLTAVVWKDKRDVCLLTNIHDPPREGNYRDEHGNTIKLAIVVNYNHHMGHVDNSDRLANSYKASRRRWKWTTKLFSPRVRPGHCQQLHPLIFMWWEKNFTKRFSSHPYQRDAGTVWAWATTIHACGKTSPSFY